MIRGALALSLLASLAACQTPPTSKIPKTQSRSKAPVRSKAQAPATAQDTATARPDGDPNAPAPQPLLGSPALPASPCVQRCVQASQMQARAIEAIEADCRRECAQR